MISVLRRCKMAAAVERVLVVLFFYRQREPSGLVVAARGPDLTRGSRPRNYSPRNK